MSNFVFKGKQTKVSNRQLKVSESLKRSISEILNRDKVLAFASGDQTYTISRVDISPDLKNAKVFVLPFGADDIDQHIRLLNDNSAFIKKSLINKVILKYIPEIKFFYDYSFEQAARISDLIDNI